MLVVFSFRPIYFVGQVLYYQLNIDYIIETYCINKDKPELQCNGKCHLAKQLQVTQPETQGDENSAISVVVEAFYPLYLQFMTSEDDTLVSLIYPKQSWSSQAFKTKDFIEELFHPPRV